MSKILVTGAAGFIGFHLLNALTGDNNFEIIGIDNLQVNQNFQIKIARLKQLNINLGDLDNGGVVLYKNLSFIKIDLLEKNMLEALFSNHKFDLVIHLAAQTGVRDSVFFPQKYIDNNITAFNNLLECCRNHKVSRLIYASSSSVYGMNTTMPYQETDAVEKPLSIYAMTKKANELQAHAYTMNNNMSTIGLRFFTVYGPWCRTDMAAYLFMKSLIKGDEISLFNYGKMLRDFTYVDDVKKSILLIIQKILSENLPIPYYEIFNVGSSNPITLAEYLSVIEDEMGIKGSYKYKPIQTGEVQSTYADVQKLGRFIDYRPCTDFRSGVKEMVSWFKNYYAGIND